MKQDVQKGGVFIFINRKQDIMKILHMEYAGMVIYYKKLESGRFRLPDFDENVNSLTINWQDLIAIIKSIKPVKKQLKRKPH